jgi:hypothetical protein
MLILTHTEHISNTSPVNEIQDYDYYRQDKGTGSIWGFKDYVCRIENQKAVKCVPFAVNAWA